MPLDMFSQINMLEIELHITTMKSLVHTLSWQGLHRVAAACLVQHSQLEVAGQAQQATEQFGHHHTCRAIRIRIVAVSAQAQMDFLHPAF